LIVLARSLEQKADSIDGRLSSVVTRFDVVDRRFSSLEQKVDKRFSSLEQKVDKLEQRVDKLEQQGDRLEQKVGRLEQKVDVIDGRLSSLEATVDNRLKETRPVWEAIEARLEAVEINLDRVQAVAHELRSDFRDWRKGMNARIENLESRAS
jgi:chromosome segregation ATPase